MSGYLISSNKEECFGCEACAQVCNKNAIKMRCDDEGFRYPVIDKELCVECGQCERVCPYENTPIKSKEKKLAYGGYIKDTKIREDSTSGGAFSAIIEAWCDKDYVIFGAASDGMKVYHTYVTDKKEIGKFRKSKYSQSNIGTSYKEVKQLLKESKSVVFSGTPCQIAGLKSYLGHVNQDKLLTIEVVCEGVPSPLYMDKYCENIQKKYNSKVTDIDYRYKSVNKWDFEVMLTSLENGKKIKKDRWFNPFWVIWLKHLMSRPSCYKCIFATQDRVSDITLGDLWGVHLYCPELYGKNRGASLIVCNTSKGRSALDRVIDTGSMYGHKLDFEEALKYQSPMRKHIDYNELRPQFMEDLKSDMKYDEISKKYAGRPTLKLLFQKYVWGNRQKMFVWNLRNKRKN